METQGILECVKTMRNFKKAVLDTFISDDALHQEPLLNTLSSFKLRKTLSKGGHWTSMGKNKMHWIFAGRNPCHFDIPCRPFASASCVWVPSL